MPPSNRTVVLLLGVMVAVLVGWLLKVGAPIVQPLVIALLLAAMLQPVLRVLMRIGIPPVLSAILILAVLAYGLIQGLVVLQSNVRAFLGQQDRVARATAPAEPGSTESPPGAAADGPEEAADEPDGEAPDDGTPIEGLDGAGPAQDPTQDPAVGPATSSGDAPTDSLLGDERAMDPISSGNEEITAGLPWDTIIDNFAGRLKELGIPDALARPLVDWLRRLGDQRDKIAVDLFLGSTPVLTSVFFVLLYTLFIFAEQAVFRRKILAIAGDRRDQAQEVLDTIGRGVQRFLGLKTLLSFATGALCYAALVALEIPYALLFGFLTFLLNFIPYFGSIAAGTLPVITAFAIQASWSTIGIIAGVYISVNALIGNVVEPRIMGRELDLSPLVILVSVVVWGSLWGPVGLFLAVPITSTLQIILAGSDTTRPIAIMLSSGPPRGSGRGLRRA